MESRDSRDSQSSEGKGEIVPSESVTAINSEGTLAVRGRELGSAVTESLFGPIRDLLNLREHNETRFYWRIEGQARHPNELLRTVQNVLEDHRFGTLDTKLRLNKNLRFQISEPELTESPSTMSGRSNYEGSIRGRAEARNPRRWVMLAVSAISAFLLMLSLLVTEIWILFIISTVISFFVIRNELKWDRAVINFTARGEMYQAENTGQHNLDYETRGRSQSDLNCVVSGRLEINLGRAKGTGIEIKNNSVSNIFDHQILSNLIIGTLIERYPDIHRNRT